MARPASDHRLLLIRLALGHDGGVTRFLSLAETLRRRGGEATVVAGPGPLEERAAEAATLRRVDWSSDRRIANYELLRREAVRHTAALVGCLPQTLPLVPGLAREVPVHLCVHSTPVALEAAFEGHVSQPALGSVLHALHSSGRVLLSAASEGEAREHEARLGLSSGVLAAFPNGVAAPAAARPSAGPIRSVTVVSRLSRQKLPHIAAAATFVAAGRALGRDARLEVHGAGPAEQAAVEVVESRLPAPAWRLCGPTDHPAEVMRAADVVVGGGRTALEALALGRRVAIARVASGTAGGLAAPVTVPSLDGHVHDNFRGTGGHTVPAEELWRMLEGATEDEVAAVQHRVRTELSNDAMLDRELDLLEELSGRAESIEALHSAAPVYAAELMAERRTRVAADERPGARRRRPA